VFREQRAGERGGGFGRGIVQLRAKPVVAIDGIEP
jgi:hypothetical protein